MAYLTKADLVTHAYVEIIDEITRQTDAIVDEAIDSAVEEAKSYLNRYDLLAMFGSDTVNPTFTNKFLNTLVKDIAIWRIIILANPNINVEVARAAYTDATKTLLKVAKGDLDPAWPLRTDQITLPGQTPPYPYSGGEGVYGGLDPSGNIGWNSNQRRQNHW